MIVLLEGVKPSHRPPYRRASTAHGLWVFRAVRDGSLLVLQFSLLFKSSIRPQIPDNTRVILLLLDRGWFLSETDVFHYDVHTPYRSHSTPYRSHSTPYRPHSTTYRPHSTPYRPHSTTDLRVPTSFTLAFYPAVRVAGYPNRLSCFSSILPGTCRNYTIMRLLPATPTSSSMNSSLIIESLGDTRFYQLNEQTNKQIKHALPLWRLSVRPLSL
jgi:hypothetical protein